MISPSVTHHGLARNHLDHAHADRRQRAREILRQRADLAHLDARGGTQLEARHHGPRLHGDDFDLDAEILKLQLDEPRERFERFRRIRGLARVRIVEQLEGWQLAYLRRLEQRNLALFLHALALLHDQRRRLDARLRARGGFLLLGLRGFLASELALGAFRFVAGLRAARSNPADAAPDPCADAIHDGEPGDFERERDARHPRGKHQERRAERIEAGGEPLADEATDDAARALAQWLGIPVQRREPAARDEQQREAAGTQRAVRARAALRSALAAEQRDTRDAEHRRKQIGGASEQKEQEVRDPCADGPDAIAHRSALAGEGKTRVRRIEAHERGQQDEREDRQRDDPALAEHATQRGGQARGFRLRGGFAQWLFSL
jgi:hypothetical protein